MGKSKSRYRQESQRKQDALIEKTRLEVGGWRMVIGDLKLKTDDWKLITEN